jgi:hypothetical protein
MKGNQTLRQEQHNREKKVKSTVAGVNKYNKTIPSSFIKVTPSLVPFRKS